MKEIDLKGIFNKGEYIVSYKNLVRSYLLMHFTNGYYIFLSSHIMSSSDFLYYSRVYEYSSEEDLNNAYTEFSEDDESFIFRISNGLILD